MSHASAATVHRACRPKVDDLLPAKRERGGANCRRGRSARALSASAGVGSLYKPAWITFKMHWRSKNLAR